MRILLASIFAAVVCSACARSFPQLVPADAASARIVEAIRYPAPSGVPDTIQLFRVLPDAGAVRSISISDGEREFAPLRADEYDTALREELARETARLRLREARINFGAESRSAAIYGTGRFADDEYDVGAGIDALVLERQTARMIEAATLAYEARRAEAERGYLGAAADLAPVFAVRFPEPIDRVDTITVWVTGIDGRRDRAIFHTARNKF